MREAILSTGAMVVTSATIVIGKVTSPEIVRNRHDQEGVTESFQTTEDASFATKKVTLKLNAPREEAGELRDPTHAVHLEEAGEEGTDLSRGLLEVDAQDLDQETSAREGPEGADLTLERGQRADLQGKAEQTEMTQPESGQKRDPSQEASQWRRTISPFPLNRSNSMKRPT